MFSHYAALVKNMRGVIVFDPTDDISQDLKWLIDRFKYRHLGVPPSLAKKLTKTTKPLVTLAYPHREVMDFVGFVSKALGLGSLISEAICLASCYVSPLLVLGPKAQSSVKDIAVDEVIARAKISLNDWKLHLRIADYSVLDLYEWSTTQAQKLWLQGINVEELIRERIAAIKKDEKRYWRLQRGEEEPKAFLAYLDLVQAFYKRDVDFKAMLSYDVNVVSACLAINVAVFVSRE
ncbi:MAG: hypothetical protein QW701_03350 [Candidatus Nezhaarchaeales archaeon]